MDSSLLQTLIEYRWWVLVPLSLWESTLVAFLAGMLAAAGYFNIYALAAFFFARDIALDLCYYALGHYAGRWGFIHRMLAKIHVTEESMDSVRQAWELHPARTMFIGKLSYGLAQAFVIAAGTVGMSIRKFLGYGALAAVVQYGTLLLLGYFFGASSGGSIVSIIENVQYVLLGGSAVLIAYYGTAFYLRRRMLKEDDKLAKQ